MLYFTIIGDMIGSRKLENRSVVQKRFSAALNEVQKRYAQQIVSPLTVTIGDEFQAVLKETSHLFALLYEIEQSLKAVSLRYGFGIGTISTAINHNAAIGMDGPAFHNARTSIEQARKTKTRYGFSCGDSVIDKRINVLLNWIDISTKGWPSEKHTILHLYRQRVTQKEIARRVSMSQSAVSQHINTPAFRLIHQTHLLIQDEINRILNEE